VDAQRQRDGILVLAFSCNATIVWSWKGAVKTDVSGSLGKRAPFLRRARIVVIAGWSLGRGTTGSKREALLVKLAAR
jgi:hypothetical protein